MNGEPAGVSVRRLSFSYPQYPGLEAGELFSELSLELPSGSITVLLGAPDAGKTTLCRILAGLVPRFTGGTLQGELLLQGRRLADLAPFELVEHVGLVFQSPGDQLFNSRCDLEVAFALESLGLGSPRIHSRVEEALSWSGLEEFRDRDPSSLSGGEKKKLLLACLHALDPPLWLLDETLEELDAPTRIRLLDYLKERGKTVLLPSAKWHELFARYAAHVVILDGGRAQAVASRPGSVAFAARLAGAGLVLPEKAHPLGAPRSVAAPEAATPPRGGEAVWLPLVEVRDLSFGYPDGGAFRLDIPRLQIQAGEVLALIGANGSGKTTLGRILCGLLEPQEGSVLVPRDGRLVPARPEGLNGYTGYLFQDPDLQIFLPTVADELGYGLKLQGLEAESIRLKIADSLERFHLPGPEVPPALMSFGARKRLQAAVCWLLERPVLVIDEGDSGLGAAEFGELLKQFRSPARGLVFITHDLVLAERLADRIVRLEAGRLG